MVQAGESSARTYLNIGGCHTNELGSNDCGYCKGKDKQPKGHKSWGISSTKMTVADYQKLMDRGWRRCGTYYYKWDFLQSCCQPYTIRLNQEEFAISASQRQVLKKFNKFLKGEIDSSGKSVNPRPQAPGKQQRKTEEFALGEDDMEKIMHFLGLVEEQLELGGNSQIAHILETLKVGPCRDRKLQGTLSWSSNCLLRLFYCHQLKSKLPEFVSVVKLMEPV